MMVGSQEGSNVDYGYGFRKSGARPPRIFIFLAIGVLLFLAITFWPGDRALPDPARASGRCCPARWPCSPRSP